MNEYFGQLETIKNKWLEHASHSYENDEEEYNVNLQIKKALSELMIRVKDDTNLTKSDIELVIAKSIILLASMSGCAEDMEIAETILDELEKKQIIDQKHFDLFYQNSSTARWF